MTIINNEVYMNRLGNLAFPRRVAQDKEKDVL